MLALCKKVDPASSPVYIPCRPVSWAVKNNCFNDVPKYVERNAGCKMVYGWTIWEWAEVWVEAEFHAVVWDGEKMVDVMPHDGESEIMFLPDMQGKTFTGNVVPNVMVAISDDPYVRAYMEAASEMNDIRAKIATEHRQPNSRELAQFQNTARLQLALYQSRGISVQEVMEEALGQVMMPPHMPGARFQMRRPTGSGPQVQRVGRNELCPCGSGKKFKHCHYGRN